MKVGKVLLFFSLAGVEFCWSRLSVIDVITQYASYSCTNCLHTPPPSVSAWVDWGTALAEGFGSCLMTHSGTTSPAGSRHSCWMKRPVVSATCVMLSLRVAGVISPQAPFQCEPGQASPLTRRVPAGWSFITLAVEVVLRVHASKNSVGNRRCLAVWDSGGELFLMSHKLGLVRKLQLHHTILNSVVEDSYFRIDIHVRKLIAQCDNSIDKLVLWERLLNRKWYIAKKIIICSVFRNSYFTDSWRTHLESAVYRCALEVLRKKGMVLWKN